MDQRRPTRTAATFTVPVSPGIVQASTTPLLVRAMRAATGHPDRVSAFIPSRTEGYGLNERGIDRLREHGAQFLIAVDCGSNDHEAVAYARSLGMEVVILDHHRIAAHTPDEAIVVSPQLLATQSPYHDLTGVGVAWLLVSALAQEGIHVTEDGAEDERSYLDLVALGTVADSVVSGEESFMIDWLDNDEVWFTVRAFDAPRSFFYRMLPTLVKRRRRALSQRYLRAISPLYSTSA